MVVFAYRAVGLNGPSARRFALRAKPVEKIQNDASLFKIQFIILTRKFPLAVCDVFCGSK
jgi:hypothetical protein